MITIEYCADGVPISDFECDLWLNTLLQCSYDQTIRVSTSLPFDCIRQAIVQGKISHMDVVFLFNGEQIKVNKFGAIDNWPKGFCDKHILIAEDILRKALNMRTYAYL